MPPLVSIVIPHYRRPALLAEAVRSIRRNEACAFEVLIIDDGSPEEDWKAVLGMAASDVRVFQRKDGIKGPSRCRNIGLAEANGEYLIFLDSDDWMAPWCLENRIMAFEENASADLVVFPVMLFKDQPGDLDVLWNTLVDERCDLERFIRSDPPWHTSSPIWKTESLRRLGGFNEAVFYGDDSDLHMRALALGFKAAKITDANPDLFIRRSDTPRITNSISSSLIESRRIRLREGTKFLQSRNEFNTFLRAWQGQYLVEAEFLLFNHKDPKDSIQQVLREWAKEARPPLNHLWIARLYLACAIITKENAYLFLRVARRVTMQLLPESYFPTGGRFHEVKLDQTARLNLHQLLEFNAETRWQAPFDP